MILSSILKSVDFSNQMHFNTILSVTCLQMMRCKKNAKNIYVYWFNLIRVLKRVQKYFLNLFSFFTCDPVSEDWLCSFKSPFLVYDTFSCGSHMFWFHVFHDNERFCGWSLLTEFTCTTFTEHSFRFLTYTCTIPNGTDSTEQAN